MIAHGYGNRKPGKIQSVFCIMLILPALFLFRPFSTQTILIPEARADMTPESDDPERYPGWIVGNWMNPPLDLFNEPWPYRRSTYEILFADSRQLAGSIYGLAIFTGDVESGMDIERFLKGAQGFHYSVDQIIAWVNHTKVFNTREEVVFLEKIIADGVILEKGGQFVSGGSIGHVLGAAPGRNRSLALNLDHERIHVYWDEDFLFKAKCLAGWEALSPEEKRASIERLKGYNKEDELSLIEEWAVRRNEGNPFWRKP